MTQSGDSPLRLTGTTRSLETIVPVPAGEASVAAAVVMEDATLQPQPLAWARILTPGVARIRLKFARHVRPGSYRGFLRVAGVEYPFVAELNSEVHLWVSPSGLPLFGAASGQTAAEVTIVNAGNGDYQIRTMYAFGVFQKGGVGRALGKAYRTAPTDPRPWIDRVGDNLTMAHGGLVRVQVKRGAGVLLPGEARNIALLFHFPDNLQPGYLYKGEIEFGNVIYPVQINVPATNNNSKAPEAATTEEAETLG
jgi:hypothetical protein